MRNLRQLALQQLERRELLTVVSGFKAVQPAVEGSQSGLFELVRDNVDGPLEVQVDFNFDESTATPADFKAAPRSSFYFADGERSSTLSVDAIYDSQYERTELLAASILDSTEYSAQGPSVATLEIVNDVLFSQTTSLNVPDDLHPRELELQITNEQNADAEFFLQVNGQLWVNIPHLVDHVRNLPPSSPTETDYQRAYRFITENTRHDFLISVDESNWHRSPSMYLNSIGFGFCGDMATALTFLWREMGYDARVWRLKGHTVSEVFADGRWQMYDADLRVYFLNPAHQVAGVEELAANPSYILRPTNAIQKPDGVTFDVYSQRMADVYSTTHNNVICYECYPEEVDVDRHLQFTLPPGATLSLGDNYSDRELPLFQGRQKAWDFGELKLTIPAGYSGTIDLSLALFDIRGDDNDQIRIGDHAFSVGSDDLHFHINDGNGIRLDSITIEGNQSPIELIYLINPMFAKLQRDNLIRVEPLNEHSPLDVKLVPQETVDQRFVWPLTETEGVVARDAGGGRHDGAVRKIDLRSEEGLQFVHSRNQYVDVSTVAADAVFGSESSFTIQAWIKLNEGDSFRRPIFDATRFSLMIDGMNRLVASYRAGDETISKQKIRSDETLSADVWHHVAVVVTDVQSTSKDFQRVQLFLNGRQIAEQTSPAISNTYTLRGPYLGLRNRPGTSEFFSGEMKHVSLELRSLDAEEIQDSFQIGSDAPRFDWSFLGQPAVQAQQDGRLVNAPTKTQGGLRLNGEDQFFHVTDSEIEQLFSSGQPVTVQAWFKTEAQSSNPQPIFDNVRFSVSIMGGDLVSYYETIDGEWMKVRADTVPESVWHRVTVVYEIVDDTAKLSVYQNGELSAQKHGRPMSTTSMLRTTNLGRRDRGESSLHFDGWLGVIKVWDRAMSDSEIRSTFQGDSETLICDSCLHTA